MKVKSKLMTTLGSLKDQAAIGRATLTSRNILSGIEIAILRSTDCSDAPLDDKYVNEILFMISNAPGSITFLARKISTRLESTQDPVVALKTLLLLHRLLRGGDRYFEQDLHNLWSSGELLIELRWLSGNTDTFCSFILSYSQFLKERMDWIINQSGKLEPIRPLLGSRSVSFQDKAVELVLYRLSKCQTFLDLIINCLPGTVSRSSHVVQSAMNVNLKESFRVYDSFCEGIQIVVGSYNGLEKPVRAVVIDILRKACIQTFNLCEFYTNCKRFIVGKSLDYPLVRIYTSAEILSIDQFPPASMTSTKMKESMGQVVAEESFEGSTDPFSQKLETKISTVWVEFKEDDSQSSSFSFEVFDDRYMDVGGKQSTADSKSSWTGKAIDFLRY